MSVALIVQDVYKKFGKPAIPVWKRLKRNLGKGNGSVPAIATSKNGGRFPDTDPRFRGISSLILLEQVCGLLQGTGYRVGNVDVMVLAEAPRIKPYVDSMKSNIARVLGLAASDVGIKATTMEGKGVIGRGEGIAVFAVALVYRSD